jgi:pimeloyl-ACP methyl ester carboxylesterase
LSRALRRWARRLGLALLVLLAALTLAAVGYDLASSGDSRAATALYRGPFVRVDGRLVAYRRWGDSGTPIVLLGGAAEPSWVWHGVGPLLARAGHRVYALDLPPFGYTERGGPYTLTAWVALVRGFARRLGIVRPLIVGHSLGAGVAAATALADPAGVRGVVFLDGDGLPVGHGIGWFSNLLVWPWYTALYRVATSSDWLVRRVLRRAWRGHRPRLTHALLAVFERPFEVAGTSDAFRQIARHGIPGLSLRQLGRLRVPRAVVWGAEDDVDSLAAGRRTAAALGVRPVVIPDAGHLSMLAEPARTATAIERAATTRTRSGAPRPARARPGSRPGARRRRRP